jgi:DNA-directed RNA polymerase subunit M
MEFCPSCGMRLSPRGRGIKAVLNCPKCGYVKETYSKEETALIVAEQKKQEQIAVIGEREEKIKTMPTAKVECPKCSNREAYWWMVQTRGSDESSTQFFRCTLCGYTWREMS